MNRPGFQRILLNAAPVKDGPITFTAREWTELNAKADAGLDVTRTLVFVAYSVTEQDYDPLPSAKGSRRDSARALAFLLANVRKTALS